MNSTTLSRCAVFAAFSVALLFIAAITPTAGIAITAAAGLMPMAAVIYFGVKYGFAVFGVSAVLALLLCPVKSLPLLYTAFLGYYPVIKSVFETKLRRPALRWGAKLVLFCLAFLLISLLTKWILLAGIDSGEMPFALFMPFAAAVFIIYDIGLSRLAGVYVSRLMKHNGKSR
jgi:hypothetical protein